ncbi:MAG: AmmeMemoRadiSam system protein B [Bacteroidales bacterium]|nr:AmmeMemoRadiSam system protein B [Bacteroidales bacterium]
MHSTYVFVFLITIFMTMNISGQQKSHDREPVVAGSFYPAAESELITTVNMHFDEASELSSFSLKKGERVRAVIAPHAGYVFSGTVAAAAFGAIPRGAQYDNIFLIGSSHRASFPGASVYNQGNYRTPLGTVQVNTGIADKLISNSEVFSYHRNAHTGEHSLEVQLPFLQQHLGKNIRIVPVIIGTHNSKICREIASALQEWFTGDNLFVISSDFSHYPPFEDATELDKITAEALMTGNAGTFLKTLEKNSDSDIRGLATSMCGWTSGLVLLHMAEKEAGLDFRHIMYRNSGHSKYGDNSGVVGYHAIVIVGNSTEQSVSTKNNENTEVSESTQKGESTAFSINHKDQVYLLNIARETLDNILNNKAEPECQESELPAALLDELGAFVSIYKNGKLRGCVGRFMPPDPLCQTVQSMARAAAFNDSRFDPLKKEELDDISIEISVLSPLKKIEDIEEIELGKHGVYLKKGYRSGTFLPQVAKGRDWTLTDFLGHIARDKAGLGWTGWKDADIYIYEAFVFGEE